MAVYVGDLLTASAAPVSGKPTPTRTWQWLRGTTAISGATSSTYTVQEADLGETLSVKQIETNIAGSAEATSLTVGPVNAFTPAALFNGGEEGAWYEPSTTTAFLSSTDLTPCGYGDGAGFLLDKSKGAGYADGSFTGLGSELVTNGTFKTDLTGWFGYNDTPVWDASERMLISAPSEFDGAKTGNGAVTGLTVGKVYVLSCDIELGTAASAKVEIYAGSGSTLLARIEKSASGSYQTAFTATTTTATIYAVSGTGATGTAYFDNISVRELPGNHATQVTAGARPILARVPEGGRRNLLEKTEQFDDAYWTKNNILPFGSGSVVDATTDPSGGTSADLIVEDTATTSHRVTKIITPTLTTTTFSVYAKQGIGARYFHLSQSFQQSTLIGTRHITVDLANGNITQSGTGSANGGTIPTLVAQSATPVGNGWYRIALSVTNTALTTTHYTFVGLSDSGTPTTDFYGRASYTGDGTSGVYIWGAQLETGSTATAYQKVVDEYDITEAGVTSLDYLSFNGASNGMATASIDFTATDKMSIFAGVERATDVNDGAEFLWELSSSVNTNTGSFYGDVNSSIPHDYGVLSRGSAAISNDQRAQANGQPLKCVLSALHDISGDSTVIRTNGAQISEATGDQGAGNFGNYPLNIGARNNAASVWFDGKIFGLIVRGASSTTQEISQTETYLAAKSGVTL